MDPVPREIEELFADWLGRVEEGEDFPFDRFVTEHPEHADALNRLHGDWTRVASVIGKMDLVDPLPDDHVVSVDVSADADDESVRRAVEGLSTRAQSFARYRLEGELDHGGMASVLRAWDPDLRRRVAMKVRRDRSPAKSDSTGARHDSRSLARFLEEAQVTGQLDHPGIVPVHEIGLCGDGDVYFTMKLVRGATLKQVFDLAREEREGWSQARVLGVLLRVCEAMAYAHDKGVIHRDLKPANVMVGRFGEVYVMDWGLARVLGRDDAKDIRIRPNPGSVEIISERRAAATDSDSPLVTMDGDVVGTPAYMSPEQARGELDCIGAASDVYALGAMLYQLLSGCAPYVGDSPRVHNYAIWARVQEGPPRPLHLVAPEAPPELVAICERAMARDIDRRYAGMLDFADDLRAFLEQGVVRAYRVGALAELRSWRRRNRGLAATLLALAFVTVIGVAVAAHLSGSVSRERAERVAAQRRTSDDLAWAGIELSRDAFDPATLLHLAHSLESAASDPERAAQGLVRFDAWDRSFPRQLFAIPVTGVSPRRIQFHPDGRRVLLVSGAWDVDVVSVDSGELSHQVPAEDRRRDALFTPDGAHLVVADEDGRVELRDPSGHQVLDERPEWSPGGVRSLVSSRDGTWLALVGDTVRLVRWSDGAVVHDIREPRRADAVSFDESGSLCAVVAKDAPCVVYGLDAVSGHVERVRAVDHARGVAQPVTPVFLESGEMIVDWNGQLRRIDLSTGAQRGRGVGTPVWLHASVPSPDRSMFVAAGQGGAWLGRDGRDDGERIPAGNISDVAWSPDSTSFLLVGDAGEAWLWPVQPFDARPVRVPHEGLVARCAFSPSGRRFATAEWDGDLRVFELDVPALTRRSVPTTNWSQSAVSAAGDRLLGFVRTDEALTATGPDVRTVRSLDPLTGQVAALGGPFQGRAVDVAASPRGGVIAVLTATELDVEARFAPRGDSEQPLGSISFRDSLTGDDRAAPVLLHGRPEGVAFHPSGELLVAVTDRTVAFVDASSGQPIEELPHDLQRTHALLPRAHLRFSGDGAWVAIVGMHGPVEVWDVARRERALTLRHTDGVTAVQFLPGEGGTRLATAGLDGDVRLWAVDELVELPEDARAPYGVISHSEPVYDVGASPDGEHLVTASKSGYARVVSLGTLEEVASLGHRSSVRLASFHPTRTEWIVTCTTGSNESSQMLRIWDWRRGLPVAPGRELSHGRNSIGPDDLLFLVDGRFVVAETREFGIDVFDLKGLLGERERALEPLVRTRAEMRSGRRLVSGPASSASPFAHQIVQLTRSERRALRDDLARRMPALDESFASDVEWHRWQAARLAEVAPAAAARFHVERAAD